MKIKFILSALLLFTLASCSDSVETVKVDGKYSIDLPSYLSKSDDLNKAASLQYKNAMREFYVLVLDEPKESFNKIVDEGELDYEKNLNGYSEILADDIAKSSGLETTPKMQQTTINNLKARILEFDGTVDNVNIHWKIAYLEGKNRYYQVLTWTIPGKTEDNGEAMMAILKSFKETDKSKRH
jgi:hypothetical protein